MPIPNGLLGPAIGDVILAQHGDRGRVPLEMSGVRVGWGVDGAGEFSAFARLSDALSIESSPENYRGLWLMWEHPQLGHWGGVITDVSVRSSQVIELAARGWLTLLEKRTTRRRDASVIAAAGPIAGRIVRDAGAVEPTGIAGTDCEAWGDFVTWRDDGGEVLSSLSRIARMSDQEYTVTDDTRIFTWRYRLGSDLTDSVQLVQGAHIAEWRPSWSLAPVVTEVVLSPSDRNRFAKPYSVSGFDADAYARFGPRQQRAPIRGRLARPSVQAIATAQAQRLARQGQLIELTVADFDGCWARFREGDIVTVILEDINRALEVRVLLRTWDLDSNVLRVSGEIQG